MLKKQAGASAKKTSGSLNEKLKKVAAAEGGGNLFELAAEGRHSLRVPLVFWHLPQLVFSAFAHSYFFGFGPSMFLLARGPKSLTSKSQFFMGPLGASFHIFFRLPRTASRKYVLPLAASSGLKYLPPPTARLPPLPPKSLV